MTVFALALSLKMFFRRRGSVQLLLALALLVAILSSVNAMANYLNFQVEAIGKLTAPGGTYIILSQSSTALTDSQINVEVVARLKAFKFIERILQQKMLITNLTVGSISRVVQVRGVEDVGGFLKARGAHVYGGAARSWTEANVGELLAGSLHVDLGDEFCITLGSRQIKFRIVGIFRSQTQSDAEIIIPMEAANALNGNNSTISFIEFSLRKDVSSEEALAQIIDILPENLKIIKVQQSREFVQQINVQTLMLIETWSIAIYAAVAAASYIIATRLITELEYEFTMLRSLGAKKHFVLTLILIFTTIIALLGSILGVALGVVGAQIASSILMWVQPSINVTPFIEPEQALKIILLTALSSMLGCIYPALKSIKMRYVERTG